MSIGLLPTITDLLSRCQLTCISLSTDPEHGDGKAEQQWQAAIAALTQLVQSVEHPKSYSKNSEPSSANGLEPRQGLIFSSPCPVLAASAMTVGLEPWIFTADPLLLLWTQLPPALQPPPAEACPCTQTVPLLPKDPLQAEQFCLVLTAKFSLVMVLSPSSVSHQSRFLFSFDPHIVHQAWQILRLRLQLSAGLRLDPVDRGVAQFSPTAPDYRTVMQFSQLLLTFLPVTAPPENVYSRSRALSSGKTFAEDKSVTSGLNNGQECSQPAALLPACLPATIYRSAAAPRDNLEGSEVHPPSDMELLQAIAHEVRTPLATISTLTRLLLKRSDLPAEVVKRLNAIYRECTDQINRFSLIFRAVELECSASKPSPLYLASISLDQVLQQSIPRWQEQAARRNLTLQVTHPQQMPAVVSDPTMLDQVLTGLVDRFTHSLPAGSHIQIQVTLAGEQLKLQLQSQQPLAETNQPETPTLPRPVLKSVGQLLMLEPQTGNLSLNLTVTKNLFQALGGKLTVRNRPQFGEVLTVFLPLGRDHGLG